MATAVAHAIVGYATGRSLRLSGRGILAAIIFSNLPDLDSIPGLVLYEDAGRTHHAIGMHRPWFALVTGILVAIGYRWRRKERGRANAARWGLLALALAHLVIDALHPPYWKQDGAMAIVSYVANSVLDALVFGGAVLAGWWAGRCLRRRRGA
ncbi:MAG: hypothetical protein EXR43_01805 [Dehalococcoidia bacterium]|nr:hypothetical protein [Dehalococcoidia bacterium]